VGQVEEMVHKGLGDSDYLEHIYKYISEYKSEIKDKIKESTIKLAKFENLNEKIKPLEELIQKAKADENPLRIEKYASDVVIAEKNRYMRIEQERDFLMGQSHRLDDLEKEIQKRNIISTKSFLNMEKSTDNK